MRTLRDIPIPIKDYLHKSGDTLTGDLTLGTNKLKFNTTLLKELETNMLVVRNINDSANKDLRVNQLQIGSDLYAASNGTSIKAWNSDDAYMLIMARDNGVGLVEVARLFGGASPSFDLKLGRLTGTLNGNSQRITNLGAPTTAGDALRKGNAEITNAEIAAGAITNAEIAAGAITNAEIAAGAAIDFSKLEATPPKFATGSYTGNGNTTARQITTGFTCKFVYLAESKQSPFQAYLILETIRALKLEGANPSSIGAVYLHTSDGFVVADASDDGNLNYETYYWVAFG